MTQNPRRSSDAYGHREVHQEFGVQGRGLSERIHIPLERRLERPKEFPMDYTPPRRSNYSQHEHRYRGGLDDRIEHDYRPQKNRGPGRRRDELDDHENRPSFESRVAATDNRTLEERIGYVQPAYRRISVYDGTGSGIDGTSRPVSAGKQTKKGAKVQPAKIQTNNITEFRMQDQANEGSTPDVVLTASERVAGANEDMVAGNGSKVASTNAPGNVNNIETKLRAKVLESIKKRSADGSQNEAVNENGGSNIGQLQLAAPELSMDPISSLQQNYNGLISMIEVKSKKSIVAIDQTLADLHSVVENDVPVGFKGQKAQQHELEARDQGQLHNRKEKQNQEDDSLPVALEKKARNEAKPREPQKHDQKSEEATIHEDDHHLEKQHNWELNLNKDGTSGHNGRISKPLEDIQTKLADENEDPENTIVLGPIDLGVSNVERYQLRPGSIVKEPRSIPATPLIPSETPPKAPVQTPRNINIQEKHTFKPSADEQLQAKRCSIDEVMPRERLVDKPSSRIAMFQPALAPPQLYLGPEEEEKKAIKQIHVNTHQEGESARLSARNLVRKDHSGLDEPASNSDRRDVSQDQVSAWDKHLTYSDVQYRDEHRQRLREEGELSRQYFGPRTLQYLPPRPMPEASYGYHPADYTSPYGNRYFPIRAEDLQGRRLELEYDPYYKDIAEWLELTGYHDLEYRQVSLRRYRELRRECFYPPTSGPYAPVSGGIAVTYEQRLFRSDRASMLHQPPTLCVSPEVPSPMANRPLPQSEPLSTHTQEEKPAYPRHPVEQVCLTQTPPVVSLKRRNQYEDEKEDAGRRQKTPRLLHDNLFRPRESDEHSKGRRAEVEFVDQKSTCRRAEHLEDARPPRPTGKRQTARLSPIPQSREHQSRSASPIRRYHDNDRRAKEHKRELMGRLEAERGRLRHDFESSPYPKRPFEKPERRPPSPQTPAKLEKSYYKPKMPSLKRSIFRDEASQGNSTPEPDYERAPLRIIRQKQSFEESRPKLAYSHSNDERLEEPRYTHNRNPAFRNKYTKPHGELDEINQSSSPLLTKSETKYFMIKSFDYQNVLQAQKDNVWATQEKNSEILEVAFYSARDVILLFSVNKSKRFQGYARMESTPGSVDPPDWVGRLYWKSSGAFKIQWITKCEIEFYTLAGLKNRYNDGEPVFVGRDCQEIDPKCGAELCRVIDERAMFSREYHNQRSRDHD